MSPEEVAAIAQVVLAVMQQQAGGVAHGAAARATLDEPSFRRIKTSSGTGWQEWSFQFRVALKSCLPAGVPLVDCAEKQADDFEPDDVDQAFNEEASIFGAQLFGIICLLVEGEAATIVHSVTSLDGLVAWRRLHERFNPRTPARALKVLMEVVNPTRVKQLKDVPSSIQAWERQVVTLERGFGQTL